MFCVADAYVGGIYEKIIVDISPKIWYTIPICNALTIFYQKSEK